MHPHQICRWIQIGENSKYAGEKGCHSKAPRKAGGISPEKEESQALIDAEDWWTGTVH